MDTAALRKRLSEQTEQFGLNVLIGSVAGAIITATVIVGLPGTSHEWMGALTIAALLALLSWPFVALGLVIFGIPAMALLSDKAHRWWVGVLAVAWGTIAGKLMFLGMDKLLRLNGWFLISEPGITFGIPTALASWFIMRRRLSALG